MTLPPLVSNRQHLAYPPPPLGQQSSAFGLPPPPPPAADVICGQPLSVLVSKNEKHSEKSVSIDINLPDELDYSAVCEFALNNLTIMAGNVAH